MLHFDADERVMTETILKRAEASGSSACNDDNLETFKKRFDQFKSEQLPIILSFCNLVHTINAAETQANVLNVLVKADLKEFIPREEVTAVDAKTP